MISSGRAIMRTPGAFKTNASLDRDPRVGKRDEKEN